jgi:L-cysteine:1D-myo-inositol 2-amino-2-deoxy-alpha-D-glucopyranoside ligase
MAIRLALLNHHYRTDWEWTADQLDTATDRLQHWRSILNNPTALPAGETIAEMRRALRDDLDAPAALRAVDAWVAASGSVDSDDTDAVPQMTAAVDALLGIRL